jgi:hypothetical protein
MVQVEVQVDAWLMHLFMVHVDYRLLGIGWCMVYALVYGTKVDYKVEVHFDAWFRLLVQVVWCRLIGTGLQQYIS